MRMADKRTYLWVDTLGKLSAPVPNYFSFVADMLIHAKV